MMLCSICEWLASSVKPFWAKPVPHSIYYEKGGWLLLIVRPVIKCSICGSSQVLRATDKMYRKAVVVVVVVVFTLKAVPISPQYFLTSVLVQLTRTPSVVTG